jgi:hypothetical protein
MQDPRKGGKLFHNNNFANGDDAPFKEIENSKNYPWEQYEKQGSNREAEGGRNRRGRRATTY